MSNQSNFSMHPEVFNMILREKFPYLREIMQPHVAAIPASTIAKAVSYERCNAPDLTLQEVVIYLLETPNAYEIYKLTYEFYRL